MATGIAILRIAYPLKGSDGRRMTTIIAEPRVRKSISLSLTLDYEHLFESYVFVTPPSYTELFALAIH